MHTERIRCPAHGGGGAHCAVWRDPSGRLHACCHSHHCPEPEILAALGEIDAPIANASQTQRNQAWALRIWQKTWPADHTLVETYLRLRGIRIKIPAALRFHPRLWHQNAKLCLPGMVAAVRDARGTLVGVHRTYLTSAGHKADVAPQKAALGPTFGGVVVLAALAETLALGEGIETMLSLQQATGIACWASLGATNLPNIELPAQVRKVFIAADSDDVGEAAAVQAARRYAREGRKVRIARTGKTGADFNDILRGMTRRKWNG